jgi:hypothetical protein
MAMHEKLRRGTTMRSIHTGRFVALAFGAVLLLGGCAVDSDTARRTGTGAAAGAAGGAVVGLIRGDFLSSALTGAAAGAASGFVVDQIQRH